MSHGAPIPSAMPANTPAGPPIIMLAMAAGLMSFGALLLAWNDLLALKLPGNDDYMRLVQLRDWLDGQSWWVVDQKRLGLAATGDIHFSRIPDLLMAPFIVLLTPLIGEAAAERFMLAAYPLILFAILVFILMITAYRIGGASHGRQYSFAAILITVAALPIAGQFSVGSIDHHTLQIVLSAFAFYALVRSVSSPPWAGAAGLANIFMLMVGLETAPLVGATALAIGLIWLISGARAALAYYSIALIATAPVALAIALPPGQWFTPYCDAYSIVFASMMLLTGIGALMLVKFSGALATPVRRGAGAITAGVMFAVIIYAFFPQCSAGPYADLDPLLLDLWLNKVIEAQNVAGVMAVMPHEFFMRLAFPLAGLACAVWLFMHSADRKRLYWLIALIFLAACCIIALWQLRGAVLANVFAVVPAAALLSDLKNRLTPASGKSIFAFASGCLFLSPVGYAVLGQVNKAHASDRAEQAAASPALAPEANKIGAASSKLTINQDSDCLDPSLFMALSTINQAQLFSQIDIGPELLAFTDHQVSAAPYHRNQRDMLRTIEVFTNTPQQAFSILQKSNADYLVYCAIAPETNIYSRAAPKGLIALLQSDEPPPWLVRLEIDGAGPLRIYKIQSAADPLMSP